MNSGTLYRWSATVLGTLGAIAQLPSLVIAWTLAVLTWQHLCQGAIDARWWRDLGVVTLTLSELAVLAGCWLICLDYLRSRRIQRVVWRVSLATYAAMAGWILVEPPFELAVLIVAGFCVLMCVLSWLALLKC